MFRGNFLALPVHAGGVFVIDLHAIHADIALSGARIASDHAGQRDKAPRIFRPALQDGEVEQRKVIALDDLFAWPGGYGAREESSGFCQQRQHLQLVEKSLRRLHVHEHAHARADFVVGIHADRHLHACFGAELID